MERNNIIKALEHCKSPKLTKCYGCPRENEDGKCMYRLNEDALALITSQEQRIKELTEEYDSIAKSVNEASDLIRKLRSEKKELTEENERLKSVEFTCGFIKPHKVLECPIFEEIEKAKADTVWKMQERLTERLNRNSIFKGITMSAGETVYDVIDQISKEMAEERK